MRNRDKMFQMSPAARSIGRGLGMSAACLIAGIATAQAQSASNENSEIERFPLRGTTTSTPQSTSPYRASTLYGALPGTPTTPATGRRRRYSGASTALRQPIRHNPLKPPARSRQTRVEQAEADFAASLARQNPRTESIDGLPDAPIADPDGVPGFMIGTLTLRPTLSQRILHESVRSIGTRHQSRLQ
jgi:hypothetical protein